MKKMFLAAAIGIAAMTITALGQMDPFMGWNCSDSTSSYCTKTLAKGETAWDFAGRIYNNATLWQRFQEDNPDKTTVRTDANGNPILIWQEGVTVRIRKSDFIALQSGVAPAAPVPVTVQLAPPVNAAHWTDIMWGLLAMIGFIILLTLAAVGVFLLYCLLQNRRALRENPLDPNLMGPPMRDRRFWLTDQAPTRRAIRVNMNRLHRSARLTQRGVRGHVVRVNLTVPVGSNVLTEYRDHPRRSRPENTPVFLGVYYDTDGNVSDVVGAFSRCENGLLLNQMSSESLRAFAKDATWSDPTLIESGTDAPEYAWEPIEVFLRGLGVTDTTDSEAADTSSTELAPQPSTGASVTLTAEGIVLRGIINLPNGMTLDTAGNELSTTGLSTFEGAGVSITAKTTNFGSKADAARGHS